MKAAIITLALAMFLLGASLTYVSAGGGFTCTIEKPNGQYGSQVRWVIDCK